MNQITKITNIIMRKTPIQLIFRIVSVSILFNIIYAIVAIAADNLESLNNETGSFVSSTLFLFLLMIVQLLIMAYLITIWYSTYYKLEGEYIFHKT